jgi:biopolymer transport protein ExbB
MKISGVLGAFGFLVFGSFAVAADTLDEALKREAVDYVDRQRQAIVDLNAARARVAKEKLPLMQAVRAAEDRVIQAEAATRRMETETDHFAENRRNLLKELDGLRKTVGYVNTLARESVKAASDGLAPGESGSIGESLQALQQQFDESGAATSTEAAMTAAELLLTRTEQSLGGYSRPGKAVFARDNQVVEGAFSYVGPETFFRSRDGQVFGTVRTRESSDYAAVYPVKSWTQTSAEQFFKGATAPVPLDASAGKALKLEETKGSMWEHIKKGGVVAFAILGVGLLAIILVVLKVADIVRLSVDRPGRVQPILDAIVRGDYAAAEKDAANLAAPTRALLSMGLSHRDAPKSLLEEHLEVVLLEQRQAIERRLPLLAVIATAAPLMGLLGTVVGMVRTFALITVFGTGNAGKLSSGISEVLVATELGLIVAIPSLVIHGFLAHRIHKNAALLERYALLFVTAVETHRARPLREKSPTLAVR